MRPIHQRVAVLFGLAGLCLAAAFALEIGRLSGTGPDTDASVSISRERASHEIGDARDVTGSIEQVAGRRLPLTDEQRGRIYDDIMRLADAPTADVPEPDATPVVPGSVALQELPDSATRDVPLVAGYKFVKLDDRIFLVSPSDRHVVAEMPRYRTVLD
jgi:hypothetical protein